jgi:hypothetical protein
MSKSAVQAATFDPRIQRKPQFVIIAPMFKDAAISTNG